ncbi:MAG: transcriptional regulator [Lysobacterales bacterium CG02_land_8_20_14_3_00_62_12]|nr:MAG: transcriptional regulator [Xanthomonadales bacterium CG02_land_8_20_14_3_00_62_12]
MIPLTDQELEDLLNELESDRAERKKAWAGDAPEKVRQAVCAFANDLPNYQQPGVVFVGAMDDGSPAGIEVTDQLLLTLSDIKTDGKVIPLPTLTVCKRTLKGSEMAVVCVWPADSPPVRYEGGIWIRVGPRRGQASAQDERILNEKRRYRDLHFEAHPVSAATLDDLSRPIFEQEYLPSAVAPDVLLANERTYEQRLTSCGMVVAADEPVPTILGLLVCGISTRTWLPGSYIQFLRIRGTVLTDPVVDEAEIDGTISMVMRRLDEKLAAHLSTTVEFSSQDREVRTSAYPIAALQQLARNAVMHRNYEGTNAPVRVYWFDDRIEISNPGGPYGSVTAENFGKPGLADYRNPQLAAAFKVLGYAQRFGAGIALARQSLQKNGNPPPEFQTEPNFVIAIIRKAP